MISRIPSRLSFANITATLALVLAMSGGALAATHYLVTSTKQISPKVLKALKGKTGPTGEAGQPGPKGETGPTGKEGAQGKVGTEGKEGSPWTAGGTLPEGKTETGTWAFVSHAEGSIRVPLSFLIPTEFPLFTNPENKRGPVEFLEPGEEDPTEAHPDCPGTVKEPKADWGFICVYAEKLDDPLSGEGPVRTSGVVLVFESNSSAPKADEGTWAMTAPPGCGPSGHECFAY